MINMGINKYNPKPIQVNKKSVIFDKIVSFVKSNNPIKNSKPIVIDPIPMISQANLPK